MMAKVRTFETVALLGMLGVLAQGRTTAQELPPAPVPVASDAAPCPVTLSGPPTPGAVTGIAPPECAPYEDRNGPLLRGDPLLERPDAPPPGWFVALDVSIVNAHIINGLVGTVTFTNGTSDLTGYQDTVQSAHRPAQLDRVSLPRAGLSLARGVWGIHPGLPVPGDGRPQEPGWFRPRRQPRAC